MVSIQGTAATLKPYKKQSMDHSLILQRFWERALNPGLKTRTDDLIDTWHEEVKFLNHLGIPMETALQFLHFQKPSLNAFKQWISENRKVHDNTEPLIEDVLSPDDLAFWEENGYIILQNAVSKKQCSDARQAIWEFLQASPDDPSSWYKLHEEKRGLMLNFFDHPALDVNRQSGRIQKAYQQLYGSNAIYQFIDKVSFNPPERENFRFKGSALHWDVSLVPPIPFKLQGLLYLTDCTAGDGAFHCVPGFHRRMDNWLSSLPHGVDPREAARQSLKAMPVPADAGDFVIWHQALPHCATPNHGAFPRMVQYLTYFPEANEEKREWR